MKKLIKSIRNSILIIILVCFAMAGIDYLRMNNNELPVFNISFYNTKNRTQGFKGIFYTASRKVRANPNESLYESSKVKFKLLWFDLKITNKFPKYKEKYTYSLTKSETCEKSSLYYADLDIKVYTYCLDEVKVNNKELNSSLSKNNRLIDDILNFLSYTGLYSDNSTMMFENDDIKIYQCNKENINDIYIGSKDMTFNNDFCTRKDDDLKYIFEIEENTEGVELKDEKEVFYEDEEYKYTFDKVKSDYIYITTPEVRGFEAKKIKLKDVLNNKLLTIDELQKKGLSFEKESKNKE